MQTLAGYELEAVLGRGSVGLVYRARPGGGGVPVALKRVPWAVDHDLVERIKADAEVLSHLDHPNLMKVLDLIDDGSGLVVVMELADGGSLADGLARRTRLDPVEGAELVAKVADGLAVAHARAIVHGDIKPSNILLDRAAEPLLSDFGLSRRMAEMAPVDGVPGTAEYLDPLVAEGAPPSQASDVYALGVVCYELLAGQLPYRGSTPLETLRAARRGRLQPLTEVTPRIDVSLAAVVERAMGHPPDLRLRSARELGDALRVAGGRGRQSGTRPAGVTSQGIGVPAASCTPAGPRPLLPRRSSPARQEGERTSRRPIRAGVACAMTLAVGVALASRFVLSGGGSGRSGSGCGSDAGGAQPRPAAGAVTMLADVGGRGCPVPVTWSSNVISVPTTSGRPPDRFALGAPGDVLLLGHWSCASAATPALYRPPTGQVFYFTGWAEAARDLSPAHIEPTGIIDGTATVVAGRGHGCDKVGVKPGDARGGATGPLAPVDGPKT